MMRIGSIQVAAGVAAAALVPAAVRDLFSPPTEQRREAATPLERLEIAQLRLVALVYDPVPRALLEDDAGRAHVATLGTAVGPRGGAVVAIEPGKLRIREPGLRDEAVLELHAAVEGVP